MSTQTPITQAPTTQAPTTQAPITRHRLTLPRREVRPEALGYFRWGRLDTGVLLTNDAGEWKLLAEPDWQRFLNGEIGEADPLYGDLTAKGFLRADLDLEALAQRVRRKRAYLGAGPHLAVVITTLRCNQSCQYCHASRTDMDRVDTDMSLEMAKKVADHAMQTPSPYLCFEYQGGEPTVNFDVLKFMVTYTREKNRYEGKTLDHSVVTNMTYMTEEKADWLIENGVLVCTSLDGPKELHDRARPWTGRSSGAFDTVLHWMQYINQRYIDAGRDPSLWHVDALTTATRRSFDQWKEIVDLYVGLGLRNIHIRPLNPFGFAANTWRAIGYPMADFLDYYERVLDYIITLNKQGVEIMEGTASTFLKKMLTPTDPNFVDIRTPVGSGTGQIAYNYDGAIYPSDEGRMVSAMGDDIFRIGTVGETTFAEATGHPTVRALAGASLLDTLPMCESCWNAPYCGVRPLHNYLMSGDLFGPRPSTPKCQQHMGIAQLLFERLTADTTGEIEKIFRRWTIDRPRQPLESDPVSGS